MFWAIKTHNYCREVNPTYEIMATPQLDRAGPHYVTANVRFQNETEQGGKE